MGDIVLEGIHPLQARKGFLGLDGKSPSSRFDRRKNPLACIRNQRTLKNSKLSSIGSL